MFDKIARRRADKIIFDQRRNLQRTAMAIFSNSIHRMIHRGRKSAEISINQMRQHSQKLNLVPLRKAMHMHDLPASL
jgi:hypothetical protein